MRYQAAAKALESEPTDRAFLFSYRAGCDKPCDPSGATHQYTRMYAKFGIGSHLHALGHGGGGATTLRVYAAWVGESDKRAAEILGGRLQRPSTR
jgi:integrase